MNWTAYCPSEKIGPMAYMTISSGNLSSPIKPPFQFKVGEIIYIEMANNTRLSAEVKKCGGVLEVLINGENYLLTQLPPAYVDKEDWVFE